MVLLRRCCPIVIAMVSVGCSAIIVTPHSSISLSPFSRRETDIAPQNSPLNIYKGENDNDVEESLVSLPGRQRRFDKLLFVTRWGGSNDNDKIVTKNYERYYLVWSPNFWKKMLLSLAFWLALQYAWSSHIIQCRWMMSTSSIRTCHGQSSINNIALSLLSSSCCAIQLVINALTGWGCAGFNSYLGPIRPALLTLFLLSTWKSYHQFSRRWTIVSLCLAFLPELVDIYTTFSRQQQKNHSSTQNITNDKSTASASYVLEAKLELNMPTMGCVACVNKVNASIRGCNSAAAHILDPESSWLTGVKGGKAKLIIRGSTIEEISQIVEEVVAAVKGAGFSCGVGSLQMLKSVEKGLSTS